MGAALGPEEGRMAVPCLGIQCKGDITDRVRIYEGTWNSRTHIMA